MELVIFGLIIGVAFAVIRTFWQSTEPTQHPTTEIKQHPTTEIKQQPTDAFYDLSTLTTEELSLILGKLRFVKSKYPADIQSIGLVYETSSIIRKPRYIFQEIIIQKYKDSKNPCDLYAVASSYAAKGANYRKDAIKYFEAYLANAETSHKQIITKYCTTRSLFFLNLAELYEKEHQLDKAIKYAIKAEGLNRSADPGFPDAVGRIYLKIDPALAVDYYSKVIEGNKYKEYYNDFATKKEKAIEKQQRGYKYKPRTPKGLSDDELKREEDLTNTALQFLPGGKYYEATL